MDNTGIYIAALHRIGFSHKMLHDVLEQWGEMEDFFVGFGRSFLDKYKLSSDKKESILELRGQLKISYIEKVLEDFSVKIILFGDSEYPEQLTYIDNSPAILYVRGRFDVSTMHMSVVGSRKNSLYAKQSLQNILPDLIRNRIGIISGGAYGIDSIAHGIALEHAGYTISVVGTGINRYYPATHKDMYERIVQSGGAVVSIFPIDAKWEPYHFPIRNEVVAALSYGVIVAEAGAKSGTLITARLALELNKDVFVIPGDITRPTAKGSNALIRDGLGKLITCSEDILGEYGVQMLFQQKEKQFADPLHKSIYDFLSVTPATIDELCTALSLTIADASVALSVMEIMTYIKMDISGKYITND